MSRINIYEQDLTTDVVIPESTDVVLVPGFSLMQTSEKAIHGDTSEGGVPMGYPTVCHNLYEFYQCFGKDVPYFTSNQLYPVQGEHTVGFNAVAIPGYNETTPEVIPVMYYANTPDPGYMYAKELLSAGLTVMYVRLNEWNSAAEVTAYNEEHAAEITAGTLAAAVFDITVDNFYTKLSTTIYATGTDITDRNEYQFKYVTAGGYPVFEYNNNTLMKAMMAVCSSRGDAFALIDHTNNPYRTLVATDNRSVYKILQGAGLTKNAISSYGTMFTPWMNVSVSGDYSIPGPENTVIAGAASYDMAPSFSYLLSLAASIKTYPSWLAIAGVTRGLIPRSPVPAISSILTNSIAESYQPEGATGVAINPITKINPYGQTIWGNRTLKDNADDGSMTAISHLNIRNMLCDIKKVAYVAANELMFEQNTNSTWISFCGEITPTLDKMQQGGGIADYLMIRNTKFDNQGNPLRKSTISCKIRIWPTYAIDKFDIAIELSDGNASVEISE